MPTPAVDLLRALNISDGYARVILHHGQARIDGEPLGVDDIVDPAEVTGKFLEVVGRGKVRLFGMPLA